MHGIYFINERMNLHGLSREDSVQIQKDSLAEYLQQNSLRTVTLNPYQLYDHYTIPHALLDDLKQRKVQLDYLLFYTDEAIEDFKNTYPARWLILKSYFNQILTVA